MKGKKEWLKVIAVCMSLVIIHGCSEELQVELPVDNVLNESIPEFSTDEVELVMIPTPVQTPTILVHSKCSYNPDHINFDNLLERSTTSNLKAISLGISIVDFSYAGVNKDHILAKENLLQ